MGVRATTSHSVAASVLAAVALSACGGSSDEDMPTPPIGGYHYNGKTDEGQVMTFSTYGLTVPLFESKFTCGKVIGTTSLESVKIEKSDDGYSFKLDANALVGYSDEKPEDNGTVKISGAFARDAKTAEGDIRVKTRRCASGRVHWTATAEPDVAR